MFKENLESKVTIFGHVDNDGFGSSQIVYEVFKERGYKNIEFIPVNYGKLADKHKERNFGETDIVFVVDFSFDPETMYKWNSECDLYLIDHHKTAIEKVQKYQEENGLSSLLGIQKSLPTHAGIWLTWNYFNTDSKLPRHYQLLNDYDIWNHGEDVKEFQLGTDARDTSPMSDFWEHCESDEFIDRVIADGRLIQQYQTKKNKELCKRGSAKFNVGKWSAICIVSIDQGSLIFGADDSHDLQILVRPLKNGWGMSIYSPNPDVDVTSVMFDYWKLDPERGGGHFSAGGYSFKSFKEIPLEIRMAINLFV